MNNYYFILNLFTREIIFSSDSDFKLSLKSYYFKKDFNLKLKINLTNCFLLRNPKH